MKTFKFKVGDSFILPSPPSSIFQFGQYVYVVSVTKEQMFGLALSIDIKGLADGDFQFLQFDLTKKEDLKLLTTINQKFPETKFGQIGSSVVYDEDEFVLFALKNVNFGTMSFIKPLLINTDKMMDSMEDVLQGADEFTDLITTFNLNYPKFSKIPLESNKSLEIFEVAPPKFPFTTVQKIEIEEEKQEQASIELIPNLKNTLFGQRNYTTDVDKVLQGFTLPFSEESLFKNGLPYTILGEGRYRPELSTWAINGARTNSMNGNAVYIVQEGENIFPKWKLTSDRKYSIGTKLTTTKTGELNTSVIFKLIEVFGSDLETKFGKLEIYSNSKGDYYLNHPEIYLGGNKYFDADNKDLFLLLGKQPLQGTQKDGINSIWYKEIGSTQFPIKTRKQIESGFNVFPYSTLLENNLDAYKGYPDMSPATFFPKSFKPTIEEKNPTTLVGEDFITNRRSTNFSWKAYRLLSENISAQSGVQSSQSEIVDKLLEYFDYENLNVIKANNPKLYDKINDLMAKSIETYVKNLPKKKTLQGKSDSVEFLILTLSSVGLVFNENPRSYYGFTPTREGQPEITDDDFINDLIKSYVSLVQSFKEQGLQKNGDDFLIPLNQFETLVKAIVPFYKYSIVRLAKQNAREVDFQPNIYGEWYLSNFVAGYDYSEMFNQYGNPFFGRLVIGEPRYGFGSTKKIQYNFNNIIFDLSFKEEDYTEENRQILLNQLVKVNNVVCDNFLVLKRFKHLGDFLNIFQYYEVASKKVEVDLNDITNDIRFYYYLRTANIIGQFQENEFNAILELFEQIRELALTTASFAQFRYDVGVYGGFVGWNPIIDLGNPRENYKKLIDEGFNVDEYAQVNSTIYDKILLEPKTVIQAFKEVTDGMKENASFKALLEGTQTPQDMWLSLFGGGSSAVVVEEEEEVVEIESEGEPKVTVEEVEDVNLNDIDWDEIDPDDIDIALSDENFLEDNIEL